MTCLIVDGVGEGGTVFPKNTHQVKRVTRTQIREVPWQESR